MAEEPLGARLRKHREKRKLGLREVAKQAGVNHGYLSQLERGEVSAPAPAFLERLAPAYGIPFPILMEWAGYIVSGLSPNQQRALNYLGEDVSDRELELVQAFLDAIRKQSATATWHARLDGDLDEQEIARIRGYMLALLRKADALGTVPTPIDHLMHVAELVSAGEIRLDPDERRKLRHRFGDLVDRAWTRLQGVIHFGAREIWVNPDMYPQRQRFVLGHELGHYALPEHRNLFAYLDDERRLRRDIHDLYERQANQAAIEVLAQGDRLRREADDSRLTIELIDALATRFAISMQAAARRIVEESRQQCALAISFRRDPTSRLTQPHLYCSRSFEERFRWKASGVAATYIEQAIRAGRQSLELEPIITADAGGGPATIELDPLRTPRAVIVLFRAVPGASRLRRLATIGRIDARAGAVGS
jgi:transcriptional regulator with XRE-family HTH domain